MKAALLALLGLALGVVAGGIVGMMAGFAFAGMLTGCQDLGCGWPVFVTTPAGMLIGGLGGAWRLGRKGARRPA